MALPSPTIDTTVFIPNYNGHHYIDRALESLIEQSYRGFKVIIVDDGSEDNSLEIASRYHSKLNMRIDRYENIGITANWNRAIRSIDTDFFTLLHYDDELDPSYLETLRALLLTDDTMGIAHCPALTINDQSQPSRSPVEQYKINRYFRDERHTKPLAVEYKMLLSGDYIVCPAVFYRTEAVQKIGLFNERYHMVQDWEYWFRVLLNGYLIGKTNDILFRYRRHATNQTNGYAHDMSRYKEEKELIEWAHAEGIKKGLLSASDQKPYELILKTVTLDIANTLKDNQIPEAKRKLQFVKSLLPQRRYGLMYQMLTLFIMFGSMGGHLLCALIVLYTKLSRYTLHK